MAKAAEVSEAVQQHVEEHVLKHIHIAHHAAREAEEVDPYAGAFTFGATFWDILRGRFMQEVVYAEPPFEPLKVSRGYEIPAIDHERFGPIALHHHRVQPPKYIPNRNSASLLKRRATRGNGLFDNDRREVSDRLIGIVGDPLGKLEEVVVGKLEPVHPNDYRLAYKRKLDIDGGYGADWGSDDGGPQVGPDPESVDGPTVKLEKKKVSG